jgi:hypothetical protein
MKIEEAKIYLPIEEGDELEDAFEEKLFEFKQFFTSRFPVPKLFNSKLNKLKKLTQAFEVLGGDKEEVVGFTDYAFNPENLSDSFSQYSMLSNEFKARIYNAKGGGELKELVIRYIELTRDYASLWQCGFQDFEGVIVSKEVDPMALEKELRNEAHIKSGNDIDFNASGMKLIAQESKRLSLWLKMDGDE